MKIGGYGSIATSSAVAAVRKPNRARILHTIDITYMERVQDSARTGPMPITFRRTSVTLSSQ